MQRKGSCSSPLCPPNQRLSKMPKGTRLAKMLRLTSRELRAKSQNTTISKLASRAGSTTFTTALLESQSLNIYPEQLPSTTARNNMSLLSRFRKRRASGDHDFGMQLSTLQAYRLKPTNFEQSFVKCERVQQRDLQVLFCVHGSSSQIPESHPILKTCSGGACLVP